MVYLGGGKANHTNSRCAFGSSCNLWVRSVWDRNGWLRELQAGFGSGSLILDPVRSLWDLASPLTPDLVADDVSFASGPIFLQFAAVSLSETTWACPIGGACCRGPTGIATTGQNGVSQSTFPMLRIFHIGSHVQHNDRQVMLRSWTAIVTGPQSRGRGYDVAFGFPCR